MSVFEEGPSVAKVITGGSLTFLMAMIAGGLAWVFGIAFTYEDFGLGKDAYGVYITGQAIIVLIVCITWGINQSIQKYVAEFLVTDKEKAERYARNGTIIIIIFALVTCIINCTIGLLLFPYDSMIGLLLLIIGPTILIISFKEGIIGNIAAIQRFDHVAVINACMALGLFAVGIPLIFFIKGQYPLDLYDDMAPLTIFGLTVGYFIQFLVAWYYGRKSLPFEIKKLYAGPKDIRIMGKIFKYGLYCAIPTIILSGAILWIPALLMSFILGPATPGLYGVIVGYSFVMLTISFMGWPMISAVSEAHAMGDQKLIDDYFRSNIKSSFNFIALFLTIFVGLSGSILALFHGSEFIEGHIPFIILSIGVSLLALEFICCTILIGVGEGRKASYVFIALTLCEIFLTVLFINLFPASIENYAPTSAILISSLIVLPIIPKLLKSHVTVPFPKDTLWKGSMSVIIAIGVGFLINSFFPFESLTGFVVGILILAGMYLLSMLLLAGYDDEDFEMIYDSLKTFKLTALTNAIKTFQKITQKSPFYKKSKKSDDGEKEN